MHSSFHMNEISGQKVQNGATFPWPAVIERQRMTIALIALSFSLTLLLSIAAVAAQAPQKIVQMQPSWAQLAPAQQKILAPLAGEWEHLSNLQRKRILATTNRYPKMKPAEQQRYSERLLGWAKLSMEQRDAARKRYRRFQSLPPDQREQIKLRWAQQHPRKEADSKDVNPNFATARSATTEPYPFATPTP